MVSSMTDSVYLNVRKHRVLCNRTVRLKRTLKALLPRPSSMKTAFDHLLFPRPPPQPKTPTPMTCPSTPKSQVFTQKHSIENPI
jgi:hypothetical protein